jgi:hypothetical protein
VNSSGSSGDTGQKKKAKKQKKAKTDQSATPSASPDTTSKPAQ